MIKEIRIPDIGDFDAVEVIEVLVAVGDEIQAEDSLFTLESDKASMEVPSPDSGKITEIKIAVGDKVAQGDVVASIEVAEGAVEAPAEPEAPKEQPPAPAAPEPAVQTTPKPQAQLEPDAKPPVAPVAAINETSFKKAHASPAIRRFARELGVDLGAVQGSGRKGRIQKEDVQNYVKQALNKPAGGGVSSGMGLPEAPKVDFAKFGEIERKALGRIKQLTAKNLHRSWLLVPHVTQFDEADITELEAFRKEQKAYAEQHGAKLTMLPILMKAVVHSLKTYPQFNASLSQDGESLILKKYYNIGVAVDTPDGLVVPVVKDVDQKTMLEVAAELGTLSANARDKKLKPGDMQGASFTISSLGGIGGTAFTPIVNMPEVAILGVSRSEIKPKYQDGEFVPRLMLPLSLSYDHRVIDGAEAAKFTSHLSATLADLRRLLL